MNGDEVARLRCEYVNAVADRYGRSDEHQRAALAEIDQFLVDMMDAYEQTGIAEPAIIAAHKALTGDSTRKP